MTQDRTERGRALVALRRIVASTCSTCGAEFTGRVGKIYCSPRCSNRAAARRRYAQERKGRGAYS